MATKKKAAAKEDKVGIGIEDKGDITTEELVSRAIQLMEQDSASRARKTLEELKIIISERLSGFKIKTGKDTWLGRSGNVESNKPHIYKNIAALKKSLGARYYMDNRWGKFTVVRPDGSKVNLVKWIKKEMTNAWNKDEILRKIDAPTQKQIRDRQRRANAAQEEFYAVQQEFINDDSAGDMSFQQWVANRNSS